MKRLLRTLSTVLLVLALPVQGFAAAGMLRCSPLHHAPATAQGAAPVAAVHHHHHAAAPAHAGHGGTVDIDLSGIGGGVTCNLCAACCLGAVLPTPAVVTADTPDSGAYVVVRTEAQAGFLTGGIERPPRAILA